MRSLVMFSIVFTKNVSGTEHPIGSIFLMNRMVNVKTHAHGCVCVHVHHMYILC